MDTAFGSQLQPASHPSFSIVNPSPACNKRKRGDFNDETESSVQQQQQTLTPPSLAVWDEAMYGGSKTLVHSSPSRPITSKSQTSKCMSRPFDVFMYLTLSVSGFSGCNHRSSYDDAKLEEGESFRAEADGEPIAPPRQKYQRRESSTVKAASSPQATIVEPVDHFSHLLGVGWTRIGSDPDTQAATRGWARYIENHYHLSDVDILLTIKTFEGACLVCARNGAQKGYFLFSEDLGQARLVAYNWDICVERLQSSLVRFETEERLMAASTPTLGAATMGRGACVMLPRPDLSLGPLPADDLMVFD